VSEDAKRLSGFKGEGGLSSGGTVTGPSLSSQSNLEV
jgi:hypothetical protein